ncbi:MAG: alpha/beta hydrolase [Bacteroidales bacterium]
MLKQISIVLFLFCCFTISSGQESGIIIENKVYKILNGSALTVDIFSLDKIKSESGRPAIAFFHGGGWAYGDPSEFHGACKWFAEKGFITFSFQYRLAITEDGSIPHPEITPVECVKDARSAIRWMRENYRDLGIDPQKIIVSGQSAGGQLALSTALCDSVNEKSDNLEVSPEPNALVLYSSNVNTVEGWLDYLMGERREEIWSISPYHNLKSNMPPAIEFHGSEDCMVPFYSIEFFLDKTKKLNNTFELVVVEGKGHYLGEGIEMYADYFDEKILERSLEFLNIHGLMPPVH